MVVSTGGGDCCCAIEARAKNPKMSARSFRYLLCYTNISIGNTPMMVKLPFFSASPAAAWAGWAVPANNRIPFTGLLANDQENNSV